MIITGIAIAYATVAFQTITHNRILTPSIMEKPEEEVVEAPAEAAEIRDINDKKAEPVKEEKPKTAKKPRASKKTKTEEKPSGKEDK